MLLACAPGSATTVVEGLSNPRSLALLPDGALVVAEAGTGKNDGRVLRVEDGRTAVLAAELPSWPYTPSEIVGPGGVVSVGDELRWVQGLGPDDRYGSMVARRGGRVELLASFRLAAQGAPDGDTRISNPFDMLVEPDGTAYVSDASANVVWRVDPERRVRVHLSWTAIENPVPTGLARGPYDDRYVALFSHEPHADGSGAIARFDAAGNKTIVATGLSAPIALVVDGDSDLVVLEFARGFAPGQPVGFAPCTGRLLRIADGRREVLHDRLSYPTDVVVAPEGGYYVTLGGAFGGNGKVVRLLTPSARSTRCLA